LSLEFKTCIAIIYPAIQWHKASHLKQGASDTDLKKSLHSNSNINQFVPASDVPSLYLGVDPRGIALGRRELLHYRQKKKYNGELGFSELEYLVACFFNSSYMNRGERQPVASHGEILQEKLAPYMLSRVLLLSDLFGCIEHSTANFFNLSRASVSPPMRVDPTAGFES
jgi:hypothetical protein